MENEPWQTVGVAAHEARATVRRQDGGPASETASIWSKSLLAGTAELLHVFESKDLSELESCHDLDWRCRAILPSQKY